MLPSLMEALLREEQRAREHERDRRADAQHADERAEAAPRPDSPDDNRQS
jgi:hypothetical protein